MPSISSVRSGRRVMTAGAGSSPWTSVSPVQRAPASSTKSWVASSRGRLREIRVDALLPAARRLGAQAKPLGGAEDPDRLEVRGLEQELARLLVDLALERAHDPGDRHRPLGIGDHEVALVQRADRAVEGGHLLALARPADDDASLPELRPVEGVERAAQREHHVVRHVDDVRDRAHAGADEPGLHPRRRATDLGAGERAADVARAALEVLDADVDLFVAVARRIGARRRRQLAPVERCDLARHAVDREQVGPVGRQLELEHVLAERQHLPQRRSRLGPVLEDEDAAVVLAQLELLLGEDHPARDLAPQLRLLELRPAREHRARKRDRNRCALAEVPRTADDLARLPLPHVDAAELEPVRVRMLPGLDDAADEIVVGVPIRVGDPATKDVLHHRGRDREALRELVGRDVELDVLAQPVERDAHQNCSRSRRSFCQSMRMSVRPWRSMKIRSRPQPKAKPETSSGS